jgi:protein Tex
VTFAEFLAAQHPEIPPEQAEAVLALLAEGYAPVFVARRRAERTGGAGEAVVRAVVDAKERWDALRERQRFVVEEIARQQKLTPELRAAVEGTLDRDVLDDLYAPFKRKRRSPAAAAREAGLEPLADWIWSCGHGLDTPLPGQTLDLWAFTFRSEEHGIADAAQAVAGAEDVLVERLAESGTLRARVRERAQAESWLAVERGERGKEGGRFAACFGLHAPVADMRAPGGATRYLAVRRGVNEGELRMRLTGAPDAPALRDRLLALVEAEACTVPDAPGAAVLARAAARALDEHLFPAAEAAVHKALRTAADDVALAEDAAALRRALLAPPFGARPVLGVHPAIRGACKVAVVDAGGRHVEHGLVHVDGEAKRAQAAELLADLAGRHGVEAVAVGEGLAAKETLRFVRGALRERGILVPVLAVTDLGLGAWSAGETARDELPDLDAGARAAVGIARRLQDPLAELARAEPRTLAPGPWVHDVSQPRLEKALAATLAACVADVGVDVNRASDVLLARVPGATPGLAHAIVEQRTAHGPFATRAELRAVPLMDARTFEQMEPFVWAGDDGRPVEDPRGRLEPIAFGPEVRSLADLRPGVACPGVVTNVTAFGAFVDIGLPHDGLVHVSRLSDQFVKDPHAVVRVGDRVEVRVVDVNREKQQIGLSMRREAPGRPAPPPPEQRGQGPRKGPEPRRDRPAKRPEPAFNNPFAALATDLRRGTPSGRSKGPSS